MDPSHSLHCFVGDSLELEPTGEGSLSSLRVALKDLFAVKGHTSSFGHARWRETHEPATAHAAVVDDVLAAGGSIVGLTKMDQLAYSLIGNVGEGEPPVNAFDEECFCGGSSSGSASAVAGNAADLAIGTDTAGSIRVPAAACGLFSIRPTHGVVPADGALPLAPSFDAVGFIAKQPDLLERAFRAVTHGNGGSEVQSIRRVLLPGDLGNDGDSRAAALASFAKVVASAAEANLETISAAEFVGADIGQLFMRLQSREIWSQHAGWVSENIGYLAPDVQVRLRRCETLSQDDPAEIDADLRAREAYSENVAELLGQDTLLVLPVLPRRGPLRAWSDEELVAYRGECFQLTAPSSLSGAPQVVARTTSGEQVYSGSLLGPRGSDLALLDLAATLAYEHVGIRI